MRIERRDGSLWIEVSSPEELLAILFPTRPEESKNTPPHDRFQARREAGTCSFCSNPPVPGKKLCSEHLGRLVARFKKGKRGKK